jgi:ketosteroid isomerase-like protein
MPIGTSGTRSSSAHSAGLRAEVRLVPGLLRATRPSAHPITPCLRSPGERAPRVVVGRSLSPRARTHQPVADPNQPLDEVAADPSSEDGLHWLSTASRTGAWDGPLAAAVGRAALVRDDFARFLAGDIDAVQATWAEHAIWHILDFNRFEGEDTKREYFALLTGPWLEEVTDARLEVLSVQPFGDHLVVVHVSSSGSSSDGPIDPAGGLMIYRFDGEVIVEGWALSKGQDATTPF